MGGVMSWIRNLFWQQEMEIAILGLQNAGKSSFVHVINTGEFQSDLMPTVGFMMHKFQKGKVRIKLWDLGGQQKFRGMWERYCRGVNVIVFVVDSADVKMFQPAKKELTDLLSKPTLTHIPLLVLFNKSDLADAQPPAAIAAALDLGSINDGRDVVFYSVSCKSQENIDTALDFLIKRSKQ